MGAALVALAAQSACTESIIRAQVRDPRLVSVEALQPVARTVVPAGGAPVRRVETIRGYAWDVARASSGEITVGSRVVVAADGTVAPMLRSGSAATSSDLVTSMAGSGVAGGAFRMPFWSCIARDSCRQLVLATPATNVRAVYEHQHPSGITAFIVFTTGTTLLIAGATVMALSLGAQASGDTSAARRVTVGSVGLAFGGAIDLGELYYLVLGRGAARRLDP